MELLPTPTHQTQADRPTGCHLMIDIETMGTLPTAPVLTIGAVLFDPQAQDSFAALRQRALLVTVDIEDAIKHSSGAEPSTLKWWLGQKPEALRALIAGDVKPLKGALQALSAYALDRGTTSPLSPPYRHLPLPCVSWANSPSFDHVILESASRACGLHWPFFFSTYRDVRTIKDLAYPNGPDEVPVFNEGVAHDAADDCCAQALLVQECYRRLGLAPAAAEFLE